MMRRVLFVEQNRDGTVGGSHHSLLLLVQNLDRARFTPVVAFYQENALIDEFKRVAEVIILPAASPATFGRDWRWGGAPGRMVAMAFQKLVNFGRARLSDVARIAAVVLHVRPDLIHLNNSVGSATLQWWLAARLVGAKWITHQRSHGSPIPTALRLDRVICISRSVRDHLLHEAPALSDRTVQIYNGISIDEYVRTARGRDASEVRAELGAQPADVVIGLVGNFLPWKGQDVFLRALPLMKSGQRVRCLLIGATPTGSDNQDFRQSLGAMVQEAGLQDRVTFTGYRKDVATLVNALDIMVHTSIHPEPMGRVILEGMALGKTVIATDHGGPQEIIENGRSGFLVPPGDERALARCLDHVVETPALRERIGTAAIERVTTSFTTKEYARRVQDVYATLWPETPGVVAPANV